MTVPKGTVHSPLLSVYSCIITHSSTYPTRNIILPNPFGIPLLRFLLSKLSWYSTCKGSIIDRECRKIHRAIISTVSSIPNRRNCLKLTNYPQFQPFPQLYEYDIGLLLQEPRQRRTTNVRKYCSDSLNRGNFPQGQRMCRRKVVRNEQHRHRSFYYKGTSRAIPHPLPARGYWK